MTHLNVRSDAGLLMSGFPCDDTHPSPAAALRLLSVLPRLVNQSVGDAMSDLLLVLVVLAARQWTLQQWDALYADLPSRQSKVNVHDRYVACSIRVLIRQADGMSRLLLHRSQFGCCDCGRRAPVRGPGRAAGGHQPAGRRDQCGFGAPVQLGARLRAAVGHRGRCARVRRGGFAVAGRPAGASSWSSAVRSGWRTRRATRVTLSDSRTSPWVSNS